MTQDSDILKEWFDAVKKDYIDKVESMIKAGIDVNIRNEYQSTALMYASDEGFVGLVKLLLEQSNINVNAQNYINNFALKHAASDLDIYNSNRTSILETLLIRSEIDFTLRDNTGRNFIECMSENNRSFLKKYELQKIIINNNVNNILVLNNHGLVNPQIKAEYPDLFTASTWGLIV